MRKDRKFLSKITGKKILGISALSLLVRLGIGAVALASVAIGWNNGGVLVSTPNGVNGSPGNQGIPKIIRSGSDSFIMFWWDDRNYSGSDFLSQGDIYGRKIKINGTSDPSWSNETLIVNTAAVPTFPIGPWTAVQPRLIDDGMGGAVTAWKDKNDSVIRARRVDSSGNLVWTFDVPGTDTVTFDYVAGIVAGLGPQQGRPASWIVWFEQTYTSCTEYGGTRIMAQRIDNASGLAIDHSPILVRDNIFVQDVRDSYTLTPEVISDGKGGIIVSWVNVDTYTQVPSGPGALSLMSSTNHFGYQDTGNPPTPAEQSAILQNILRGGMDQIPGIIEFFNTPPQHSYQYRYESIYGQRINISGKAVWKNTDPVYTSGMEIVKNRTDRTTNRSQLRLTPDSLGGEVLAWQDNTQDSVYLNDLFVQRVDANGNIMYVDPVAGTSDYGLPLVEAPGDQYIPSLIYSGGSNPGMVIAWSDGRDYTSDNMQYDLYVQKFDLATGASLWDSGGKPICTDPGLHGLSSIAEDGTGGAYILWHDMRYPGGITTIPDILTALDYVDVYVSHISNEGNLDSSPGTLLTGSGAQGLIDIVSDGQGGAILAWSDNRNCSFASSQVCSDVYAQRVGADFWQCFPPIAESTERAVEVDRNPCLENSLELFHGDLYSVAVDQNRTLREKIFAASYLLEKPALLNSSEWSYLISVGFVNLVEAAIYQINDNFLLEKGFFCLVHLQGDPAANLIRKILYDIDHPEFIQVLLRHSTLSDSQFLANLLFSVGFLESTSYSEVSAQQVLPYLSAGAIPWEEFITYLPSLSYPLEKRFIMFEIFNRVLISINREEIPSEIRDSIRTMLFSIYPDPLFGGQVLIALGFIGGAEDFLINELKTGLDEPELVYALGEGGRIEQASDLLEMVSDPLLDSWRRIRAARAAYSISMRFQNLEIMNNLVENGLPLAKSVLLDESLTNPDREDALLLASGLAKGIGFTLILHDLFQSTKDSMLLSEGLRLAPFWADCSVINEVDSLSKKLNKELSYITKWDNKIAQVKEMQTQLANYIEQMEAIDQDSLSKLEKVIALIPIENYGIKDKADSIYQSMSHLLDLVLQLKGASEPQFSMILFEILFKSDEVKMHFKNLLFLVKMKKEIAEEEIELIEKSISILEIQKLKARGKAREIIQENIDRLKEKDNFLKSWLQNWLQIFLDLREISNIISDFDDNADIAFETYKSVNRLISQILFKSGFPSIQELVDKESELRSDIYSASETYNILLTICSQPQNTLESSNYVVESSLNNSSTPNDPTINVFGYVKSEDSVLLGRGAYLNFVNSNVQNCINQFCVNNPNIVASVEIDPYGFYKVSLESGVKYNIFISQERYPYLAPLTDYPYPTTITVVPNGRFDFNVPYLKIGSVYDGSDLDANAQMNLALDHNPQFAFSPYEQWFPTTPWMYYQYRSSGEYSLKYSFAVDPPSNYLSLKNDFYGVNCKYCDTNDKNCVLCQDNYIKNTVIQRNSEGLEFVHINHIPATTKYVIQYYLFYDLDYQYGDISKGHIADWEHSCHYVNLPQGTVYQVGFHHHADNSCKSTSSLTYFQNLPKLPQRVKVFIEGGKHGAWNGTGSENGGWKTSDTGPHMVFVPMLLNQASVVSYLQPIYLYGGRWGQTPISSPNPSPRGPSSPLHYACERDYNDTSETCD